MYNYKGFNHQPLLTLVTYKYKGNIFVPFDFVLRVRLDCNSGVIWDLDAFLRNNQAYWAPQRALHWWLFSVHCNMACNLCMYTLVPPVYAMWYTTHQPDTAVQSSFVNN